jgi:TonB family protein
MYSRLLILGLAAASLAAAPLHAQSERLASNCKRSRVRAEERDRRSAADRQRDSARVLIHGAILEDARASARAAGVAAPEGMLLFVFDRQNPGAAELRALWSNVPAEVLPAIRERALPRLAEWPAREASVVISMRLDSAAPAPDSTPGFLVECVPELDNRKEVTRLLSDFASQNRDLLAGRATPPTTRMKMLVSREGEVAYAEIDRSSGQARLDLYAAQVARQMRFRPAAVNGRPVDVWVVLPVSIASPPATARDRRGDGAWPGSR